MPNVPYVIESTGRGEATYDIHSRLLKDRIILISTPIVDVVASVVCAELLFLESQDPEKDISLYINSPGGSISDTMAIYDTMRYISAPVSTVCMGSAVGMGAFLLAGGEKGRRFALPSSRIVLSQPQGGYGGQATDVEIHARNLLRLKARINGILAENTGMTPEKVAAATDRVNYLTAEEARDLGVIDRILVSRLDMDTKKRKG